MTKMIKYIMSTWVGSFLRGFACAIGAHPQHRVVSVSDGRDYGYKKCERCGSTFGHYDHA